MFLKGKLLLLFDDNDVIYRLLLTILLFANPALHFLFYGHYTDPLWLRLIGSAFALVTLIFTFSKKENAYRLTTYATIIAYLITNNFILLKLNSFSSGYLFCSLNIFLILTLFCRKNWEFFIISTINFITIIAAYITTGNQDISLFTLAVILIAFDCIACLSFLLKLAYRYHFKRAMKNIVLLNRNLMRNDERLRESKQQLESLINSINDIIFEYDANRKCINVWYSQEKKWHFDPKAFVDTSITEVIGKERALPFIKAMDTVFETKAHVYIEFQSVFGVDMWFSSRFSPVFASDNITIERVVVATSDITEQKKNAIALEQNKNLLLEAQKIARIANWGHVEGADHSHWSENFFSILEVDEIPEGFSHFDYYLSLVHPDDKEVTYLNFEKSRTTIEDEFTHKLITPKGNLKYIKVVYKSFDDGDGKPKRFSGIIQDVTEAKLAEKAVKMSQKELVEAQMIARIGNWKWDIKTNHIFWSDEIYRIYDLDDQAHDKLSIVRAMLQYVHPDDKAIVQDFLRSTGKGIYHSYEFRIITPQERLKHVSIIIGKVMHNDDGGIRKVIGTLQDVTERREAELAHLRVRNKYQTVLETIKLAAITLDNTGRITFCNKYLANLLGYEQNEMIGLDLMEHFIPEELHEMMNGWFAENAIPSDYINPLICRNGERRVISWQNTISYDEAGNIKETTSIGEDITDQQLATQALVTAKEQAEKLSRSKSEFLSVMSHEIRTPMNAVIGTTNLLMSENPRPEQMEYLNTLKFSGENLLAIINDILDYNKIEAGKLELNHTPFNLKQLVNQLKQAFYPRAAEKQLDIELIVDQNIPDSLMGDPVRLGQIINNLLSNAVKFTAWGKVTIKMDYEPAAGSRALIRFGVNDTGIGIATENLEKIFEPFTQETQSIYNEYGGTGLGLAITKRLIDMHGSQITVSSEHGKGTCFKFDITFDIDTRPVEVKPITHSAASGERSLSGMNILLVDDNKMNLLIAARFLKKWDATTEEALNGEIAVDMVKAKEYDLIIMDLQMPVMDGFEATEKIRLMNPGIPVIALTADAMPETFNKALSAGMNDYMTKPFVPDVLFEKVLKFKRTVSVN